MGSVCHHRHTRHALSLSHRSIPPPPPPNSDTVAAELTATVASVEVADLESVVCPAIGQLAMDKEPIIRCRVMEQMAALVSAFVEKKQHALAEELLLPTTVRGMTDSNEQVRVAARMRLAEVLASGLIGTTTSQDVVIDLMDTLVNVEGNEVLRAEALEVGCGSAAEEFISICPAPFQPTSDPPPPHAVYGRDCCDHGRLVLPGALCAAHCAAGQRRQLPRAQVGALCLRHGWRRDWTGGHGGHALSAFPGAGH